MEARALYGLTNTQVAAVVAETGIAAVVGAFTTKSRAAGVFYGIGGVLLSQAARRPVTYRTAPRQCGALDQPGGQSVEVITQVIRPTSEYHLIAGMLGLLTLGVGFLAARASEAT